MVLNCRRVVSLRVAQCIMVLFAGTNLYWNPRVRVELLVGIPLRRCDRGIRTRSDPTRREPHPSESRISFYFNYSMLGVL